MKSDIPNWFIAYDIRKYYHLLWSRNFAFFVMKILVNITNFWRVLGAFSVLVSKIWTLTSCALPLMAFLASWKWSFQNMCAISCAVGARPSKWTCIFLIPWQILRAQEQNCPIHPNGHLVQSRMQCLHCDIQPPLVPSQYAWHPNARAPHCLAWGMHTHPAPHPNRTRPPHSLKSQWCPMPPFPPQWVPQLCHQLPCTAPTRCAHPQCRIMV